MVREALAVQIDPARLRAMTVRAPA